MKIRFIHFLPDYNKETQITTPNTSKIWAVIQKDIDDEDTVSGYGYIENIFGIEEIDKDKLYDINILSIKFMEHANGGRTNTKQYNSIEEYWADPKVKENVMRCYKEGFSFKLSYRGSPDELDVIVDFEVVGYEGHIFTLSENLYPCEPPEEWYSESLPYVIENLKTKTTYETYQDALEAQTKTDDFFGERYFPVLKAPKHLKGKIQDCCDNFKGHSKALTDGENIYIGIRSKDFELGAIKEIYEQGGSILVDAEWDWE